MTGAIEVVGAVIVVDGRILCARRAPGGETGGLWEFPGGKVEPAESPQDALAREIREELGCTINVGEHLTTTTHEYAAATVVLSTYLCELVAGIPRPHEHTRLTWLVPSELPGLSWAPADVPAMELLHAPHA